MCLASLDPKAVRLLKKSAGSVKDTIDYYEEQDS